MTKSPISGRTCTRIEMDEIPAGFFALARPNGQQSRNHDGRTEHRTVLPMASFFPNSAWQNVFFVPGKPMIDAKSIRLVTRPFASITLRFLPRLPASFDTSLMGQALFPMENP